MLLSEHLLLPVLFCHTPLHLSYKLIYYIPNYFLFSPPIRRSPPLTRHRFRRHETEVGRTELATRTPDDGNMLSGPNLFSPEIGLLEKLCFSEYFQYFATSPAPAQLNVGPSNWAKNSGQFD